MDKTEMYARMADCEEVQGQHGYRQGFYAIDNKKAKSNLIRNEAGAGTGLGSFQWTGYIAGTEKSVYFYLANYPPLKYISLGEWREFTWLPTQDQIQGMFGEGYPMLYFLRMLYTRHDFKDAKTFEQLWLGFYIAKKHNKTWDGEKWVKSK